MPATPPFRSKLRVGLAPTFIDNSLPIFFVDFLDPKELPNERISEILIYMLFKKFWHYCIVHVIQWFMEYQIRRTTLVDKILETERKLYYSNIEIFGV